MATKSPPKAVLVVEDDPGMQEFLARVAREAGFRVELAGDGIEAVEKTRKLKPAAVILDLMLPRYGGYELLYELKRVAPAVPLLIVTARFTSASDQAKISAQPNVASFFEKPVKPDALAGALRAAVA